MDDTEETVQGSSHASNDDSLTFRRVQRRVYKNILSISFAFMAIFLAYLSLQNLQSSLNIDGGIGLASLSVIYTCIIISSLFLTPLIISIFGCKWSLVVCACCYAGYAAANFYPTWYTMMPSSVLLGLAAGPLWSAKCTYLTSSGIQYAKFANKSSKAMVTRFFGIFYTFFMAGSILGNIILSLVLRNEEQHHGNQTVSESSFTCGAMDCPTLHISGNSTAIMKQPNRDSVNVLMGIFLGVMVLGILPLIFFVEKITVHGSKDQDVGVKAKILASMKLMKDARILLLAPLLIFSGMMMGFSAADLTKSYVTCPFGVNQVGYVMISKAAANGLLSFFMDKVISLIGHGVLVLIAGSLNVAILVFLLVWTPQGSSYVIIHVVAAVTGLCEAVWVTRLNAYFGILFPMDQEAAFSNLRIWQSLGFVISFAYGNYLCVKMKIYIQISVLPLSVILYFVAVRLNAGMTKNNDPAVVDKEAEVKMLDKEAEL